MNLTRSSSRASACRKWQACAADEEVERNTSPRISPTEETVSLTEISFGHHPIEVLEHSPYSNKMYSQVFPGKRVLELPRDLPRLRLSRTNCFIVVVSPAKRFVKFAQAAHHSLTLQSVSPFASLTSRPETRVQFYSMIK